MKKTANIIALVIAVSLLFCSCGKDMGRLNYNYDMSKYVKLDNYAVEVDSASESYKEYYAEKVSELLIGKLTEGTVLDGDIVNIDYVGKKDGTAFSGGTAKGYDLEIGSDSFIDGFEDGLIGVEVGKTVDLNLTFPSDYDSEELAGQAVVFTVTVNYINRPFEELNDENAKLSGFDSASEIEDAAKKYAAEGVAWDTVYNNAEIEYPKKETEVYVDFIMYNVEQQILQGYGITFEQYLTYSGMTEEDFEETIRTSSDVESLSHNYALSYYILDASGTKLDTELFNEKLKEMGEESVTAIGKEYIEATVVFEMAIAIVGDNATVK